MNVATLLLLRAANRAREMAMRYALGARRSGIFVAPIDLNMAVLGLTGAIAGVVLAPVVAQTLVRILTSSDPGSEPYSASVDMRVRVLHPGVLPPLATLFFSVVPAFHFLRLNLHRFGCDRIPALFPSDSQRFRQLAVGVQIALSASFRQGGAGLFLRTLDNLRHVQLGFQSSHLAQFTLDPTNSGYGDDRTTQIVTSAVDALRQIPGITSVAANNDPELVGNTETSNYSVQGYKAAEDEHMNFEEPRITAGYFATIGQAVLAGREFALADTKTAPHVAVVNMAFVKRFFGTPQNALGRLPSSQKCAGNWFLTTSPLLAS